MTDESRKPEDQTVEFVDLMTNAQRNLHGFILTLLNSPEDVDDVLQETNRILWSKREDFEHGTNFYAWAFRIARFQVMAFFKTKSRERYVFDDQLLDTMTLELAKRQETKAIRHSRLYYCLEKLNEADRNLVNLRYQDTLRVNKISAIVNRSAVAIRQALFRIRNTLRRCIEQDKDSTGA